MHRTLAAAVIATAGLLSGCAGTGGAASEISISAAPYRGSDVEVLQIDGYHTVRFFTPSGGWEVIRDAERRERRDGRVLLTLVRPEPGKMQLQALIEQVIETRIRADRPISVLMRTVDFGEEPGDLAYQVAATAGPSE